MGKPLDPHSRATSCRGRPPKRPIPIFSIPAKSQDYIICLLVSCVIFVKNNNELSTIELGWCPEEAFSNMIEDAIKNMNNPVFWKEQAEQDLWIHQQIEAL